MNFCFGSRSVVVYIYKKLFKAPWICPEILDSFCVPVYIFCHLSVDQKSSQFFSHTLIWTLAVLCFWFLSLILSDLILVCTYTVRVLISPLFDHTIIVFMLSWALLPPKKSHLVVVCHFFMIFFSALSWCEPLWLLIIYHFYSYIWFGTLDVCCAGKAAICNVIMKSSRRHPLNLYPATVATTLNPASSYARAFWPAMPSHSPYLVPGNYDQRHLFFSLFIPPIFPFHLFLSPHLAHALCFMCVFCVSLSIVYILLWYFSVFQVKKYPAY